MPAVAGKGSRTSEFKKRVANHRAKKDVGIEPTYFNVQLLSSTPAGKAMKYERLGTLESVLLVGDENTLQNIKTSCLKHFQEETKVCDILLGERGPSARESYIADLSKIVHCRLLETDELNDSNKKESACKPKNAEKRVEPEGTLGSCMETEKPSTSQPKIESKSAVVPKSVNPSIYMKAGEFIESNKSIFDLTLEKFDVEKSEWCDPIFAKFIIHKEEFSRGGFQKVFKAKCIKGGVDRGYYLIKFPIADEPWENPPLAGDPIIPRKSVQMHSLAKYFACRMTFEAPGEFGQCFKFTTPYFTNVTGVAACLEEYIGDGTFVKYINNNGDFILNDDDEKDEVMMKAEAFMHFSFIKSQGNLMITDIQGIGYYLTDPEVASKKAFDGDKKFFCEGNCSIVAITNFMDAHDCNKFCKLLGSDKE